MVSSGFFSRYVLSSFKVDPLKEVEMRFMKIFSVCVGLFSIACLLFFQGCSEHIPLPTKHTLMPSPEPELQPIRRLTSDQTARMKPAHRDRDKGEDGWERVREFVRSRRGGKVRLDGNSVKIPKGALKEDTFISIAVNDDLLICDFGPDGTVFNKPVKITISYEDADLEGVDEDSISVYWWNPERSCWERIESKVDKNQKKVSAEIWHFSRYALI